MFIRVTFSVIDPAWPIHKRSRGNLNTTHKNNQFESSEEICYPIEIGKFFVFLTPNFLSLIPNVICYFVVITVEGRL